MWMSVEVVSGVRIVQCHAIIDVVIDIRVMQCHAIIDVVSGVRVMLCHQAIDNSGFSTFLNFPLRVQILILLSCCINSSSQFPVAILCTLLHRENTSFEVWYLHPIDVVVNRHEDDAIFEIFRQNFEFFLHHVLDFTEEHQRDVPCENLPLENDWFSAKPDQLTTRSRVSKPLNFVRPRFDRLEKSAVLPTQVSTES